MPRLRGGLTGVVFNGCRVLVGMMKKLGRWMVVTAAQQCEWTSCNCPLPRGCGTFMCCVVYHSFRKWNSLLRYGNPGVAAECRGTRLPCEHPETRRNDCSPSRVAFPCPVGGASPGPGAACPREGALFSLAFFPTAQAHPGDAVRSHTRRGKQEGLAPDF